MLWLLEKSEQVAAQAEKAQEHVAEHVPIIVKFVNHYLGPWAYDFEMK